MEIDLNQTLADGRRLILASSSPFRRELLARLRLPFATLNPDIDESLLPHEDAQAAVFRLAELKARAVAAQQSNALVISSDQLAVLEGEILGKPGDHEHAVDQLTRASGKTVMFYTGLCLMDSDNQRLQREVIPFWVVFRSLNPKQIESYLHLEQPYSCAGSFKSEGLGIALFERLQGEDPTSLIGLPLIRLIRMLEAEGVEVL